MTDAISSSSFAEAILAIGQPAFPERLLKALHDLAGTQMCSAFTEDVEGGLQYLFAEGVHPDDPGFARRASIAYASKFWLKDGTTRRILSQPAQVVHVIRQAWNGIQDPEYRRTCYESGGVVERITLYRRGNPSLIASAYRMRESGPSSPQQIEALEAAAPSIMAAIVKHAELILQPSTYVLPNREMVTRQLLDGNYGLSPREASVAAALSLGHHQEEIATLEGVAMTTVITYRRRAYRKLGVSRRRELQNLLSGKTN